MRFGLLGKNLNYSLSPKIHQISARYLGLKISYDLFSVNSEEECVAFVKKFVTDGGLGLNITQPYKRIISQMFAGSKSGSYNTLVFRRTHLGEGNWLPFEKSKVLLESTDGFGFLEAVRNMGWPLEKYEEIVMVGDGGAAQSVLNVLEKLPCSLVCVSRNLQLGNSGDKEGRWCHPAPTSFPKGTYFMPLDPVALTEHFAKGKKTLLIQGTHLPHLGDFGEDYRKIFDHLNGEVFDMAYGVSSNFLLWAKERNLLATDGIPMLIEQARLAQKLWWGNAAPAEVILAGLEEVL